MQFCNVVTIEDLEDDTVSLVVYAVLNRLEEGDRLLHIFASRDDALAYAHEEAELNELDDYVVIAKELN